MSPDSGAGRAKFLFDLASPVAYLAAERVNHVLGEVPEWVPVWLDEPGPFRCAEELAAYQEDVERAARAQAVQPMRWPDPFPSDSEFAMLVATYAKQIGRAVAFSLAAFRQAFAAGRDLGERDTVLLAAAACEMHPAAVIKGAELRGTRERLDAAGAEARAAGVREVPAVVTADGRVVEVPA
ncbi:MAG TPA: DsbA family protein [Solirubrobacteraceae bacterium]|jgi:2-hydroxychromene-2-carboxylate isomerase|nr:DsbA family protein [Solirubrobacteraceae bacterium]